MNTVFKKRIIIPIIALLLLLTTSAFKNDFFEIAKQIEIFTTLFKELNMNYVDETNPGELMNTAIKSMLNDLDPYTKFHNEQDVESFKINNSGEYTGIGATIKRKDGRLFIIEPFKGYPADKAGLKAGDEIIQIDNIKVANYKDDTTSLLKGAKNSTVKIYFIRQGKKKETQLTRASVEVNAVPFYKLIDNSTGYIVLSKFNQKAFTQTKKAIQSLKQEGAKQLILDLRGNPGGLLRESIRIVNLFVPKGEVIVTTKSKIKKYNKTYKTSEKPLDTKIPLAILVNERSASASEIVSGALQDLDRAIIVGSRSFGKGLVQRPKNLTYGTQLKVTISRYYTPSGRCIQALDYKNRDEKGNAIRTNESSYTAFKTKNGRTVYDGGGVDPDIKVDKNKLSNISKALIKEQIIFNFCTDYYYKNPDILLKEFSFSDEEYDVFKNYVSSSKFVYETGTEKSVKHLEKQAITDNIDINTELKVLKKQIARAKKEALTSNKKELTRLITNELVTRYYYKEGLYNYHVFNDESIQKSIQILSSDKYNLILK
jgi:carboxyl-terminal processing protease